MVRREANLAHMEIAAALAFFATVPSEADGVAVFFGCKDDVAVLK